MVRDRFASENPYVLPVIVQTARNNQVALNVTLQEAESLKSTSVALRSEALASNPANPVPVVTAAGQQTVGAALGGIDQPDRDRCFLGNTIVSLWREPFELKKHEIEFSVLYQVFHKTKKDKELAIVSPWNVLSYDEQNNRVKGKILDVFKTLVYEYVHVTFEQCGTEPATDVVGTHRYFTPVGEYVPIKELLGQQIVHEDTWQQPVVKDIVEVKVPAGIYVYNLHVETYQNYCANGHRVHNLKPLEE